MISAIKYCNTRVFGFLHILQNGHTALMYASAEGHTTTAQALIQAKADTNLPNKVFLFVASAVFGLYLLNFVHGAVIATV